MATAELPSGSGNLAQKVVSIAAGDYHTLALSGDGKVYSWGRGARGQLGTGSEEDELVPVRVKFDFNGEEIKIVGISAGTCHSLALADNGSVWSWGHIINNQLSVTTDKSSQPLFSSLKPLLLEGFLEGSPGSSADVPDIEKTKSVKVSYVKAGGTMSLAIDHLGTLWIWGNCPPQTISTDIEFKLIATSTPSRTNYFKHPVVKVACGNEHIVALVRAGEGHEHDDNVICYSWGLNNHGQLGLGDYESRAKPEIIKFDLESPLVVCEVSCGAFHTAMLVREKKSTLNLGTSCWTFGLGDNGQLGQGTTKTLFSPKQVEKLPENVYLVSVDCGLYHTSIVSSIGEVFSWGSNKGLGLCPDSGDAISPLLYASNGSHESKFSHPVQVACGAAHTVLVADLGNKVWSWGKGRSGVLGDGKTVDCFAPNLVSWPPSDEILNDDKMENKFEEMKKRLVLAEEENTALRLKLELVDKYASVLHGSIFEKPFEEGDLPLSLKNSGTFDVTKEWEELLESSDREKLVQMEMFYTRRLDGIKDEIMKKKIKEICSGVYELLSNSK